MLAHARLRQLERVLVQIAAADHVVVREKLVSTALSAVFLHRRDTEPLRKLRDAIRAGKLR